MTVEGKPAAKMVPEPTVPLARSDGCSSYDENYLFSTHGGFSPLELNILLID